MLPRPLRSSLLGASQCDCCQASKAFRASCRLIWKGTTLGTSDPWWKAARHKQTLTDVLSCLLVRTRCADIAWQSEAQQRCWAGSCLPA